MSQKTILSFFKAKDTTSPKEVKSKSVVVKNSPVKKTKNKRKVQCLESDDEPSEKKFVKKDLNGDSNKPTAVSAGGTKSPSNLSKHKENGEVKQNGSISSEKPSKIKKVEDENEQKSPVSSNEPNEESPKLKDDCIEPSTSSIIQNESCDKTNELPGTSNENGSVEFIPKRKTARKQMNSSKNKRSDLKVEKTPDSKICEITDTNGTASDKSPVEKEEDTITTVKDSSNETCDPDISADTDKKPQSKTSPKDKKSTDKKHKTTVLKAKGSPKKKNSKKESIQSFFTPMKKTDDESMEVDDTEEKPKECKQEEDSPVKKSNKRRTRVQCLDSDDEENDAKPDASVNNETKETKLKTCSTSPKKDEVKIKAPDNSPTEEEKSPSKETDVSEAITKDTSKDNKAASRGKKETSKSDDTTPKKIEDTSRNDDGKQKLSLKSTSAVATVYDPSKSNYHPIEDACWKRGEKVPYLALAKTLELIENISGRLKMIEILSNFLRSVIVLTPDDMLQSVYLCLNRLAPEYEAIELGVGETLLMKAVAQATGRTVDKIKAEVAVKGDLGLVSESSRGNQRVMFTPPKLTVSSVFQKFLEIAKMTGNSSMAKKTDKIKGLFVACRDCEAKYIIRSLSGKLRIGLAEQSVLSAIARAVVLTPPNQTYPPEKLDASKGRSSDSFKELLDSQTLILKTAYCECPNYDLIIPVLLKEGISALPERCQLSPGVPLKPMLAHPTDGIDKVLERFDKNAFTCEFKYDGERAQIHMTEKGDVKIFSRNQEDNTTKYPDIISRLSNAVKENTKSFILDSEAVAWDKETKQILPFQVLSTRKRKDAVESEIVVQVCIMAFDLLYLNGESLVKKPLKERRSLLHSSFSEVENEFMFAQYRDGNSAETMQEFLDESVKGNCEGLMVKALETDASYEIAKRSHNWLKLKKDYLQGIGDTLDLVVIGGYYGKGKRTGNYGGFLLACYDEENEEFQSICKLGTGFKDDNLEAHTKFLKQHVIEQPKSYYRHDHSLAPDDWFEAVQVWEIKCADLSISPVHKAAIGIVDPEKGISLRFPRFVRIRDDKTPENATNSVQIADMYQKQQQIQNTSNKNAKVEEDYY